MTWFGNYTGGYFVGWFGSIATLFLLSAVYDKTLSLFVYFEATKLLQALYDKTTMIPVTSSVTFFNLSAVYDKNKEVDVIYKVDLTIPIQEP